MDYFKCNGSMINRVIINDLYDLPILNIRNQILSLKDKITIYRGDDNKEVLATISQKSILNIKKYTLEFFNQATDKKEFLDLKCDLMGSACGVFYGKEKDNAPMVCKIVRKIENKSILASPQESYYVDISPGVDIAIIVAATICFDQLKKE
ncbi:tubby C-terminal-like domain-containing protein [Neocallimastix sp. 'constans']